MNDLADEPTERLALLVASKATFLGFLAKRLRQRADAEDILHAALLEAVAKPEALHDEERLFGWFYRILRNKVTDHWRRTAAAEKAHAAAAAEIPDSIEADTELYDATCACVHEVMETLKPEQVALLRSVYLEGQSLAAVAESISKNRNNAGVKLH
ncbi:MAG: sigma-70 family RNA polymerase sigma factor, partial [Vicinamibacteria bacterium]